MTTVVAFRFPTGRYHATPWDRSVNEGTVEWPPSPWRLLRAFYATWRWRAPDLDQATVTEALSALAVAPSFLLPRHTEGHTRHYYPDTAAGTDKVLDPFACLDPQEALLVRWPTLLPTDARAVVARLCDLLPHLGRADSLCQARLLSDQDVKDLAPADWLDPGDLGDLTRPAARVLAPTVPLDIDALRTTTTAVRRGGRTTPPGSRWLSYPTRQPVRPPALAPRRPRPLARPTAVRLKLAAGVLPTVHQTVTYGHVLRRAAMSQRIGRSLTLSGRAEDVRRDGHAHAHYLPLDVDDDRLLDAVVVWAPEGLDREDVTGLTRLARLTHGAPGFRPVRVAVEAVGDVTAVAPELVERTKATRWRSRTPFAPYRHQSKAELFDFLRAEVDRELATRSLPPLVGLQLLSGPWLDFLRLRPNERASGVRDRRAVGLEVELAEPIAGPLSLGALSHFGLGLFRPVIAGAL